MINFLSGSEEILQRIRETCKQSFTSMPGAGLGIPSGAQINAYNRRYVKFGVRLGVRITI